MTTGNMIKQYLRCYAELEPIAAKRKTPPTTPSKPRVLSPLENLINTIGAPYHGWVFVVDTETTLFIDQSLTVGAYAVYGIDNNTKILLANTARLTREALDTMHECGLFYNPETVTPEQIKIIEEYAHINKLPVHTKQDFITRVFYKWVHKHQALCIGHNLAFDISRLATNWVEARGIYKDGFSFRLCDCTLTPGYNTCTYHPNIRVRSLGGRKALYGFSQTVSFNKGKSKKSDIKTDGKFLDTMTFGRALLGPGKSSLLDMGKRFKADILKTATDTHGVITPEYLTYNINDVKATFSLFTKQRDLYKLHGTTRPMWKIYSEASLGKAYLDDMKFPQFMKQHASFPKEALGFFMSTYYGGRSEVKYRRKIGQCMYADFKSQYPTVNALQGLQELLLAEHITITRDINAVKTWIDNVAVDELLNKSAWHKLRGICQIIPNEDVLPVRSEYNGSPSANIGVNYISSNIPTWYTIADAVASKLITGKTPHIVDVMVLIPHGCVKTTPYALFGDDNYKIDLNTDDLFTSVINLRSKVRNDAKKAIPDSDEYSFLDGLQMALKLLANSTSYGVLLEVIPDELEKEQKGTVYADRTIPVYAARLEKTGKYFAGAVGSLIPAGGRLLLAMAERMALNHGIGMGMNDTDSAIFIKPDAMTQDAFYKHIKNITSAFDKLTPYKTGGALFELEDSNFDKDGNITPLYFFGVSTKRYAIFNHQDGVVTIRGFKEHGLGDIAPPVGYKTPFTPTALGQQWIHDCWMNEILMQLGYKPKVLPLDVPEVHHRKVTTTHLMNMYSDIPYIRPFSFFSTFPPPPEWNNYGCDVQDTVLYAPHITNMNGDLQVYRRDTNEKMVIPSDMLRTITTRMTGYFHRCEYKATPHDGEGWLERQHVQVIEHIYIGKEYLERYEMAPGMVDNSATSYTPTQPLGVFTVTRLTGGKLQHSRSTQPRKPHKEYTTHSVNIQDILRDAVNRIAPLTLSRAVKVGLNTIYRALNGESIKVSTAEKITSFLIDEKIIIPVTN